MPARSRAPTVPIAAGLTIDHITLPFLGAGDLGPAQYPLTVLWFVALMNMINFIDGMDGLAAGITGLGATTFAILAASLGRADPAIMAAALAGACVAFLVFNFHPARVFMGDSGSMLLGFVIAGVAISGVMKTTAAIAVVAPLLILAIPILDTSFVILKRLKHGLPIYSADRSHFHHRFFAIGWGQRKTVLALYGWCALMGAVAVALRFVPYDDPDGAGTARLVRPGGGRPGGPDRLDLSDLRARDPQVAEHAGREAGAREPPGPSERPGDGRAPLSVHLRIRVLLTPSNAAPAGASWIAPEGSRCCR